MRKSGTAEARLQARKSAGGARAAAAAVARAVPVEVGRTRAVIRGFDPGAGDVLSFEMPEVENYADAMERAETAAEGVLFVFDDGAELLVAGATMDDMEPERFEYARAPSRFLPRRRAG